MSVIVADPDFGGMGETNSICRDLDVERNFADHKTPASAGTDAEPDEEPGTGGPTVIIPGVSELA